MPSPDDLIPATEAAQLLGTTVYTLARWVRTGRITATMKMPGLTGARLFRRGDVEALRDEAKAAS